jgi:hypothetical protein
MGLLRSTLRRGQRCGDFDYIKNLNINCYHENVFSELLKSDLPKLTTIKCWSVSDFALAADNLKEIALSHHLKHIQDISVPFHYVFNNQTAEERVDNSKKYFFLCYLLRNSIKYLDLNQFTHLPNYKLDDYYADKNCMAFYIVSKT